MKKKMSREERAEYKGGKYMGGPAEERAEKKKGKRMAAGGRPDMPNPMGMKVSQMAQAPGRMGGIGQQVSPIARAQNEFTKSPGIVTTPVMPGSFGTPVSPRLTGPENALAMRNRNLARFQEKMAGRENMADVIGKRREMIDAYKAQIPMKKMKAGGLVKANGVAQRGKTRGKIC